MDSVVLLTKTSPAGPLPTETETQNKLQERRFAINIRKYKKVLENTEVFASVYGYILMVEESRPFSPGTSSALSDNIVFELIDEQPLVSEGRFLYLFNDFIYSYAGLEYEVRKEIITNQILYQSSIEEQAIKRLTTGKRLSGIYNDSYSLPILNISAADNSVDRSRLNQVRKNTLSMTINSLEGELVQEEALSLSVSTGTSVDSSVSQNQTAPSTGVGGGTTSRFSGRAIDSGDTDATIVSY